MRDAGVGITLNVNQAEATFPADPAVATLLAAAGAPGLVGVAEARAHLAASLRGSRAGHYQGRYAGDDTGWFSVFVDRSGGLVGCAYSDGDDETFGVDGDVELNGDGVFGNTTTMSEFEGTVGAGVIEGTWSNSIFAISGTFSGSWIDPPELVLDAAALAPFLGTYTGTYALPGDAGPFTLTALAGGDLDITDGSPGEIRATVLRIAPGSAAFRGVADDGTLIRGTLRDDGTTSGTLYSPHDGVSGTFSGSL